MFEKVLRSRFAPESAVLSLCKLSGDEDGVLVFDSASGQLHVCSLDGRTIRTVQMQLPVVKDARFLHRGSIVATLEQDPQSSQMFLGCYSADDSWRSLPLGGNAAAFTACNESNEIITVTQHQLTMWSVAGEGVEHLLDVDMTWCPRPVKRVERVGSLILLHSDLEVCLLQIDTASSSGSSSVDQASPSAAIVDDELCIQVTTSANATHTAPFAGSASVSAYSDLSKRSKRHDDASFQEDAPLSQAEPGGGGEGKGGGEDERGEGGGDNELLRPSSSDSSDQGLPLDGLEADERDAAERHPLLRLPLRATPNPFAVCQAEGLVQSPERVRVHLLWCQPTRFRRVVSTHLVREFGCARHKIVVVHRCNVELFEVALDAQGTIVSLANLQLANPVMSGCVQPLSATRTSRTNLKSSVLLYLLSSTYLDVWLVPLAPEPMAVCEDLASLEVDVDITGRAVASIANMRAAAWLSSPLESQSTQRLKQLLGKRGHRPALLTRQLLHDAQFERIPKTLMASTRTVAVVLSARPTEPGQTATRSDMIVWRLHNAPTLLQRMVKQLCHFSTPHQRLCVFRALYATLVAEAVATRDGTTEQDESATPSLLGLKAQQCEEVLGILSSSMSEASTVELLLSAAVEYCLWCGRLPATTAAPPQSQDALVNRIYAMLRDCDRTMQRLQVSTSKALEVWRVLLPLSWTTIVCASTKLPVRLSAEQAHLPSWSEQSISAALRLCSLAAAVDQWLPSVHHSVIEEEAVHTAAASLAAFAVSARIAWSAAPSVLATVSSVLRRSGAHRDAGGLVTMAGRLLSLYSTPAAVSNDMQAALRWAKREFATLSDDLFEIANAVFSPVAAGISSTSGVSIADSALSDIWQTTSGQLFDTFVDCFQTHVLRAHEVVAVLGSTDSQRRILEMIAAISTAQLAVSTMVVPGLASSLLVDGTVDGLSEWSATAVVGANDVEAASSINILPTLGRCIGARWFVQLWDDMASASSSQGCFQQRLDRTLAGTSETAADSTLQISLEYLHALLILFANVPEWPPCLHNNDVEMELANLVCCYLPACCEVAASALRPAAGEDASAASRTIRLAISERTATWCGHFEATTRSQEAISTAAPTVLTAKPATALQLQMMGDMANVNQLLQAALAVVLSVARHCSRDSIGRIVDGIAAALRHYGSEHSPGNRALAYFLGFLSTALVCAHQLEDKFQAQMEICLPYLTENVEKALPFPQGLSLLSEVIAAICDAEDKANRMERWKYLLSVVTGDKSGQQVAGCAQFAFRLQELCYDKLRSQVDLDALVEILPEQAASELVLPLLVQLAADERPVSSH